MPIKWPGGNEFGFLDFGNLPINENEVYLINNYKYPHWVINRSDQPRLVLNIGANLHKSESLTNLIKRSFLI